MNPIALKLEYIKHPISMVPIMRKFPKPWFRLGGVKNIRFWDGLRHGGIPGIPIAVEGRQVSTMRSSMPVQLTIGKHPSKTG